jgi:hypothetical protein
VCECCKVVCECFKALRVVRATSAGTRVATTTLTIIVNGTVVPNANEFDPDKDEALRKTEIKSEGRRTVPNNFGFLFC